MKRYTYSAENSTGHTLATIRVTERSETVAYSDAWASLTDEQRDAVGSLELVDEKDATAAECLQWLHDHFDYNAVLKTMKALNWTWADAHGVPTINQMKGTVDMLFYCAVRMMDEDPAQPYCCASTGGFTVRALRGRDSTIKYAVEFTVTSTEC